MRLFISSLSEISNGTPVPIPVMDIPVQVLTGGVDTSLTTLSWFYTHLASDFPELTDVTKKYFFIYSTDHQPQGTRWGEGNNLDLSDFTDKGRVLNVQSSSETPFLARIDGKICIYFHPVVIPQQTDLWYIASGTVTSLTDIDRSSNWTFVNTPLGLYTLANGNQIRGIDETHTGYLTIDYINGGWLAQHLGGGTNYDTSFSRYSHSQDGITFTRGDDIPRKTIAPIDGYTELRGSIFTRSGINYGLFRHQPDYRVVDDSWNKKRIFIATVDENYLNPVFISWIDDEFVCSDFTPYINGDIIHLHICSPREAPTNLYYSTFDISDIDNWIIP